LPGKKAAAARMVNEVATACGMKTPNTEFIDDWDN
jgi:hypothetical protein